MKNYYIYLSTEKEMSKVCILLTLITLLQKSVLGSEIPKLRGVAISKNVLYQSKNNNFTCLDGIKVIPYNQLNDDYCDCRDGSDEPGTSACPNGFFHCTNSGHRSLSIPSSRVNDGICDCCDGSDEFKANEKNSCQNSCMELGRVERVQRKIEEEMMKKGVSLKSELSAAGKKIKSERTHRLLELEERLKSELNIKSEKEAIKKEAEQLESEALEMYKEANKADETDDAGTQEEINGSMKENDNRNEAVEAFKSYDTNSNGLLEVTEIQAHLTFDKNRDGVVSVEEAKFFLEEQDQIDLEEFISLSWARVKPYLMLADGVFEAPKAEADIDRVETLPKEEEEDSEPNSLDIDPEEDSDGEENYESDEEDVREPTTTTPKPTIEYDPETQKVIDLANSARNAYSEAERSVREIEQEIKEIQNQNAKDYGAHEEFATLDGECYTFEDREYIYKLCPFDRASQQQKSGGSETTLGRWENWMHESNGNRHFLQKYSHGASCWNGPQRTAIVRMKCGLENKITGVTEPNRCEYSFVFETPAACLENTSSQRNDFHDEL